MQRLTAMFAVALVSSACGDEKPTIGDLQPGEACRETSECAPGLGCDGIVCRALCNTDSECSLPFETCINGLCNPRTESICGDRLIVSPEACDDGNTGDGDGCSATCTLEAGWTCSGAPSVCSIDLTPDPFSLTDLSDVPTDSWQTSEEITVAGFEGTLSLVLTGATATELIKNGTASGTTTVDLVVGDRFNVRMQAAAGFVQTETVTVTLGDFSTTWSITTIQQADCTPGSQTFASLGSFTLSVDVALVDCTFSFTIDGANGGAALSPGGAGGQTSIDFAPGVIGSFAIVVGGAGADEGGSGGGGGGGSSQVTFQVASGATDVLGVAGGGGGGGRPTNGASGGDGGGGGVGGATGGNGNGDGGGVGGDNGNGGNGGDSDVLTVGADCSSPCGGRGGDGGGVAGSGGSGSGNGVGGEGSNSDPGGAGGGGGGGGYGGGGGGGDGGGRDNDSAGGGGGGSYVLATADVRVSANGGSRGGSGSQANGMVVVTWAP